MKLYELTYLPLPGISEDEQKAAGVLPSLLRVSVGIEYIDDIIADFEQALNKI